MYIYILHDRRRQATLENTVLVKNERSRKEYMTVKIHFREI